MIQCNQANKKVKLEFPEKDLIVQLHLFENVICILQEAALQGHKVFPWQGSQISDILIPTPQTLKWFHRSDALLYLYIHMMTRMFL